MAKSGQPQTVSFSATEPNCTTCLLAWGQLGSFVFPSSPSHPHPTPIPSHPTPPWLSVFTLWVTPLQLWHRATLPEKGLSHGAEPPGSCLSSPHPVGTHCYHRCAPCPVGTPSPLGTHHHPTLCHPLVQCCPSKCYKVVCPIGPPWHQALPTQLPPELLSIKTPPPQPHASCALLSAPIPGTAAGPRVPSLCPGVPGMGGGSQPGTAPLGDTWPAPSALWGRGGERGTLQGWGQWRR